MDEICIQPSPTHTARCSTQIVPQESGEHFGRLVYSSAITAIGNLFWKNRFLLYGQTGQDMCLNRSQNHSFHSFCPTRLLIFSPLLTLTNCISIVPSTNSYLSEPAVLHCRLSESMYLSQNGAEVSFHLQRIYEEQCLLVYLTDKKKGSWKQLAWCFRNDRHCCALDSLPWVRAFTISKPQPEH